LKDIFEKLGEDIETQLLNEKMDNESIVHMLRTIKKQGKTK
jgi:hypothetical protein